MKTYKILSNMFYKTLYGIMVVLLAIGAMGTVYKIVDVSRTSGYLLLPVAICTVAGFSLLVMLCFFVFRSIDNMNYRGDRLVMPVAFATMTILYAFLLIVYHRSVQSTDSFICLDVAKYIANGGVVDNNTPFSSFMAMYPNNYCFVLACSLVLKFFAFLPERGIWIMMYINTALHIMLAELLAWDIVKRIRDIKAANKVLFLSVINPIFYFGMLWIYTNSYSFPLIVGAFYLLTRALLESNNIKKWIFLALGSAVSLYGFKLRATSIFPVIAMVAIVGIRGLCRKSIKWIVVSIITFAVTFAGLSAAFNNAVDRYFSDEIRGRNLPAVHWLCIGSTGNGLVDTASEFTAEELTMEDTSAMAEYCRKLLAENYRRLGVVGTLKLWGRKYATTWSAGYTDMHLRTRLGETDNELATFFTGDRNFAFRLYCNLFRILTFAGMLLFAVRRLKVKIGVSDNTTMAYDIMTLTVFGGMLFYIFWEAKTSYSNPFLIFMILIAAQGFDEAKEAGIFKKISSKPCAAKFLTIALCVIVVAMNVIVYASMKEHIVDRINAIEGNELCEIDATDLEQTFVVRKSFNRIIISAVATDADTSGYDLSISENDDVIYQCQVLPSDVINGRIVIELPFVVNESKDGENEYRLSFDKIDDELPGILFFGSKSSYFSTYRGELKICGVPEKTDILMEVQMVTK